MTPIRNVFFWSFLSIVRLTSITLSHVMAQFCKQFFLRNPLFLDFILLFCRWSNSILKSEVFGVEIVFLLLMEDCYTHRVDGNTRMQNCTSSHKSSRTGYHNKHTRSNSCIYKSAAKGERGKGQGVIGGSRVVRFLNLPPF